jgi:AcrR family transcriptional regulator
MTPTPIRERNKLEARNRILVAARSSFVHQGYESFSLRKLAKTLGYSPAALYKHFKNKSEIFDCLAEESFQALVEASAKVEPLPDEDPVDRLKRGMHAYVAFGLNNPDHYRFAFLVQQSEDLAPPKPRAVYEGLASRVQACVDARRFRPLDIQLMAQSLWAAAHGVTSLLVQRPAFPWAARDKLIAQVIDSAVTSLLVEKYSPSWSA